MFSNFMNKIADSRFFSSSSSSIAENPRAAEWVQSLTSLSNAGIVPLQKLKIKNCSEILLIKKQRPTLTGYESMQRVLESGIGT